MANINDTLKAGLKSMELPKKKKKADDAICCPGDSSEKYPWGLRIELNTDCLKALGLNTEDFTVGKEKTLTAKCDVTSVSKSESKDSTNQSVSLQITSLAVEK
jgi:hypothetical protein